MERKLVKQGVNALTMTLPANWIQKNNLTSEDRVYITEENNKVIISTNNVPEPKIVKIDITNLKQKTMYHIIVDKYIQGYDVIEIKHNSSQTIENICLQLVGMFIENLDDRICILKNIIEKPNENYDNILRRVTQLLLRLTRNLKEYANPKFSAKPDPRADYLLDYTILYGMRYLSKYEITRNVQKNFMLLSSIELIGDFVKDIFFHIKKQEHTAQKIIDLIEKYVICIHTNNFEEIYYYIKEFLNEKNKKTYLDALVFSLAEVMSNYLAYTIIK